jgi:fluoride ion exporter CrcB/FEX
MASTTCALTNTTYQLIDMCSVLKVLTDLSTFINDAFSPLIQLMVLVIVLGAVLSIVGAILYTVFSAIKGSFGGWR